MYSVGGSIFLTRILYQSYTNIQKLNNKQKKNLYFLQHKIFSKTVSNIWKAWNTKQVFIYNSLTL